MKILNRFTEALLKDTGDADLSRADLSRADLSRADLSGANLIGANLSGANLSGANLRDANLSGANLSRADLIGANLRDANLIGADLRDADLSGANLSRANLSRANLSRANLSRANLSGANLSGANLSGANLSDADLSGVKNLNELTLAWLSRPPAEGSFIAWKKCRSIENGNDTIIKLSVPAEAKRSSATGYKCRAQFVDVLEGDGVSLHDHKTEYHPGQRVTCDSWCEDRWTECGGGIHFYMSRVEAENH